MVRPSFLGMIHFLKTALTYLAATALIAAVITFGGLLFPKHEQAKKEETVEVKIEDEAETQKKKPEVKVVKQEEAVETKDVPEFEKVQVEQEQSGPQSLAQNSLDDIANMINGGGEGGAGGGPAGFGNLSGTLGTNIFGSGGDSDAGGGLGADSLDQPPRAVSQPQPKLPAEVKRQPGVIDAMLYVDERGQVFRVEFNGETNPSVVELARDAFLKWRFEPGQRDGKPAGFRLKQKLRWGGKTPA